MDDKLKFMDEDEPKVTEDPKAGSETVEEKTVEVTASPEKLEDPEVVTGEEPSTPPVDEHKQTNVPVTALLDEREKRQAAQREAEEARKQMAVIEAKLRELQTPKEAPDFYSDPEAAIQGHTQKLQEQLWDDKLNMSEAMAVDKFGAEAVEEAKAAFISAVQSDPTLYQRLRTQAHPYAFVMDWHKREKFLSEVKDPDVWREEQMRLLREQIAKEAEGLSTPKPTLPPASLAKAPSAGGDPKSAGSAFDQTFG